MWRLRSGAVLCAAVLWPLSVSAQDFKFQNDPGAERQAAQATARDARVAEDLATPCRQAIKDQKIAVIIGEEQGNGVVVARQENYGPHFQLINGRLQALGLRTYAPEEIRKQIAQAEIDAYFRNNPDAALSAARRLGANYVLRGLISSQAAYNPIVRVNQVSVGMGFTLAASDGRTVANAAADAAAYAGPDVRAMALTLLNEQADEVVSRLYSEYCRNSGVAVPAKAKK
jgi:hypothetical protein